MKYKKYLRMISTSNMNSAIYTKNELWSFNGYKLKQILRDKHQINHQGWVDKKDLVFEILNRQRQKLSARYQVSKLTKNPWDKTVPTKFNNLPPDIIRLLSMYLTPDPGNWRHSILLQDLINFTALNDKIKKYTIESDVFVTYLCRKFTDHPERFPDKRKILNEFRMVHQGIITTRGYEKLLSCIHDSSTAIIDAAKNGYLDIIVYLDQSPNHDNYRYYTLMLEYAANNGHLDVVKYIINKKLRHQYHTQDPIRLSLRHNHLEITRYLLNYKNQIDLITPNDPITLNDIGDAEYQAWDYGTDVSYCLEFALIHSVRQGNYDIIPHIIKRVSDIHENNDEALIEAVLMLDCQMIRYLVSKGANIHARNDQAMKLAELLGSDSLLMCISSLMND